MRLIVTVEHTSTAPTPSRRKSERMTGPLLESQHEGAIGAMRGPHDALPGADSADIWNERPITGSARRLPALSGPCDPHPTAKAGNSQQGIW
jgi:hypothetical protein